MKEDKRTWSDNVLQISKRKAKEIAARAQALDPATTHTDILTLVYLGAYLDGFANARGYYSTPDSVCMGTPDSSHAPDSARTPDSAHATDKQFTPDSAPVGDR